MFITLVIINIVLALAFLASGLAKVSQPRAALAKRGMGWTDDFSVVNVKLIGAAEVVGAVGLVVPLLTGVAPVLSPIAAVCLAIIMVGAIVVHVRRSESFLPALVFAIVSLVSAVLGFVWIAR
jgi:uncharacterized membrane protein YphA (DoxX/SURF4 family)